METDHPDHPSDTELARDVLDPAEALAARIFATAERLYEAGAPSNPVIDDPRIERYQQWRDEPLTESEQRDRQRRVDAELAERWWR